MRVQVGKVEFGENFKNVGFSSGGRIGPPV